MKLMKNIAFAFMALCVAGYAAPLNHSYAAEAQAPAAVQEAPAAAPSETPSFTVQGYWNDDANYPIAFSQGGVNRYLDLSSAVITEQTVDEATQVKSTVMTYDVIMVDGDNQTKFSYKTLVKTGGEATYIYGWKGTGWTMLTDRSFNQPQYNAALILIDHFDLK